MAGTTKAKRNHHGWVTLFGWEASMEIPKTRFGRQLYARVRSLIRSRRPAALGRLQTPEQSTRSTMPGDALPPYPPSRRTNLQYRRAAASERWMSCRPVAGGWRCSTCLRAHAEARSMLWPPAPASPPALDPV